MDEMNETLSEILALIGKHKINKIFVDSHARTGQVSVTDIYQGAVMLANKLGPGNRVAVLVNQLTDDHTLFENVATNRGAIVSYFQNEDSALDWLLNQ